MTRIIAPLLLFAFAALAHAQTTQTVERLQVTDKIVLKDRYSETTAGPSSPGTRASVENAGVDWNTPNNAGASDNAYTTVSLASGQLSDRLRVSNFGFSLPAGAVVLGIEVTIDRKSSVFGRGADSSVKLMKAGAPVGQNKAKTSLYTTTETATVYGSIGDWWETTWTKDDVNNSGFGVEYIAVNNSPAAILSIDHVRVRVRYKSAAGHTDYAVGIKPDGDMAISRGSDPNASESILIDKDTGEVSFPAGVNSTVAVDSIHATGDIRTSEGLQADSVKLKNDSTGRAIDIDTQYVGEEIPWIRIMNAILNRATWVYIMPNGTPLDNGSTTTDTLQGGGVASIKLFADEYPSVANYRVFSAHASPSHGVINSKKQGVSNAYPLLFTVDDLISLAQFNRNSFIFGTSQASGNLVEFRHYTGGAYQYVVDPTYNFFTGFGPKMFWVDKSGNATTTGTLTAGGAVLAKNGATINNQAVSDSGLQILMHGEDAKNATNDFQAATETGTPTYTSGRVGNAITLSGSGQYLNFGDYYDQTTNDFSIAFWFNTSYTGGNHYLMDKRNSGFSGSSIYMTSAGQWRIEFGTSSAVAGTIGSTGWNDGAWHHAVFAYDRDGNCTLYIDGIQDGTRSISSQSATDLNNNGNYNIGQARVGSNRWTGSIDEYAQWSRLLSAGEARALYSMETEWRPKTRNRITDQAIDGFQLVNDRGSHPTLSTGQSATYRKGIYYVIAYNDGGTTKYRYLTLTSTDATWTYSTSAP